LRTSRTHWPSASNERCASTKLRVDDGSIRVLRGGGPRVSACVRRNLEELERRCRRESPPPAGHLPLLRCALCVRTSCKNFGSVALATSFIVFAASSCVFRS
jgi:hypothetical protein